MSAHDKWTGLFPEADAAFVRAVEEELFELKENDRKTRRPAAAHILLMIALLLGITATVGIAAVTQRWGILEFTAASTVANLSEEASRAINAAPFEVPLIENRYGSVRVTEAVYDGMAVYMVIEVTPPDERTMIIPSVISHGSMQAWSFGRSYPKDLLITEYAQQMGYEQLLAFECMSGQIGAHFYDSAINEDGTFSIMLWGYVRPEYRELDVLHMELNLDIYMDDLLAGYFDRTFDIPCVGGIEHAEAVLNEPVVFQSGGFAITAVQAIRTPMSTYLMLETEVTDSDRFQMYKAHGKLSFLDESGETIPKGAHPLSFWVSNAYQMMGEGVYYITNRMFDEMPDSFTFGVYDGDQESGWTEGETYTFYLQ